MGSALGMSTPYATPTLIQGGYSPYSAGAGFGTGALNPGQSIGPFTTQHQLLQLLQAVPQQLQQIQQLEYQQQQQIHQLQQVLQIVPAQIAQLQQVIQIALQQIQQSQQQPLGQLGAGTSFGMTPPWGIAPQFFGAQSGQQVM
jgi:hypothetical protein